MAFRMSHANTFLYIQEFGRFMQLARNYGRARVGAPVRVYGWWRIWPMGSERKASVAIG